MLYTSMVYVIALCLSIVSRYSVKMLKDSSLTDLERQPTPDWASAFRLSDECDAMHHVGFYAPAENFCES